MDLAVLHYESQTRTETLNADIMSEVKSICLKMYEYQMNCFKVSDV